MQLLSLVLATAGLLALWHRQPQSFTALVAILHRVRTCICARLINKVEATAPELAVFATSTVAEAVYFVLSAVIYTFQTTEATICIFHRVETGVLFLNLASLSNDLCGWHRLICALHSLLRAADRFLDLLLVLVSVD